MLFPTESKIIDRTKLGKHEEIPRPVLIREGLNTNGYMFYTIDITYPQSYSQFFTVIENGQEKDIEIRDQQTILSEMALPLAQNWTKGMNPAYVKLSAKVEKWLFDFSGIGRQEEYTLVSASHIDILVDMIELLEEEQKHGVIYGYVNNSHNETNDPDFNNCINNKILCHGSYIQFIEQINLKGGGFIGCIIPNCKTPLKFNLKTQSILQDFVNGMPAIDMCLYYLDETSFKKFNSYRFYNPAVFKFEELEKPSDNSHKSP